MRLVQRRFAGPLVVGWLLGLLTAFLWPAVSTERQTVVVLNPVGYGGANSTGESGEFDP